MPGTYWIKLYDEILDDPKMGTLPDRLYRRVIELFLLAGRTNRAGALPDTASIAWLLRQPIADLQQDLEQIAATGIIQPTETGWLVTKFAERQAPIPDADRKRHQRTRDKQAHYYGHEPVTETSRNVTQITESESDTETEGHARAAPPVENLPDISPTQRMLETVTGIMPSSPADFQALTQIEAQNPTLDDIQAAVDWVTGNGNRVIYYRSLVNPIRVAIASRVQSNRAVTQAGKQGGKSLTPLEKSKAAIRQVLEEFTNGNPG